LIVPSENVEADAETALAILTGPRNHVNAKEKR
jgi:hypothetical protein